MKTVADYNFEGKKALVRVDFNVPLNEDFQITDDTRMRAALPTLKKILGDGGAVVLMSHLGRPKEGPEEKFSLQHLVRHLSDLLGGTSVRFATDCVGELAKAASASLQPGEVLILENTRFHKAETKGDEEFARKLSELGDVYVNDAFGTAHRAHASTTIVANYFDAEHKMFGLLMAKELDNAAKVMEKAEKPFTAILGGAKVSDKILIIERLLDKADNIIIGGGMAYTFWKARGGRIGKSLVENDKVSLARELMAKAKEKGVNLLLPSDSIIADAFKNDAYTQNASNDMIAVEWMGLDIGPQAISDFEKVILDSKTILWNGPMGVFEMENFANGTKAIARAVAAATKNGAFSLVGGGDSVAAINQLDMADEVSYVSTGGGALLEFFEGKQLPGVMAIEGVLTQ